MASIADMITIPFFILLKNIHVPNPIINIKIVKKNNCTKFELCYNVFIFIKIQENYAMVS